MDMISYLEKWIDEEAEEERKKILRRIKDLLSYNLISENEAYRALMVLCHEWGEIRRCIEIKSSFSHGDPHEVLKAVRGSSLD